MATNNAESSCVETSEKDKKMEEWEICDLPNKLKIEPERVDDATLDQNVVSKLKQEIAELRESLHNVQLDLKKQLSKENLISLYHEAVIQTIPTVETQLTPQEDKHNAVINPVTIKQENLPNSSNLISRNAKPDQSSIWAISSMGGVFTRKSTKPKDNTYVKVVDLTDREMPIVQSLPIDYVAGTEITFTGCIKENAESMHVNVENDLTPYCQTRNLSEYIPFHFNPRFSAGDDRNKIIVMNTKTDNKWGKEQRVLARVFQIGKKFTLKIMNCFDGYEVYVDGIYCYLYRHYQSVSSARLWIQGDVIPFDLTIRQFTSMIKPPKYLWDAPWQQIGGHLRQVESSQRGVTWGIGYDDSVWVYNGGWGGSLFGNPDSQNVNDMIDHENYYIYEKQTRDLGSNFNYNGSIYDENLRIDAFGKHKSPKDLAKLLTTNWQWTSDWEIDFGLPRLDSEGWKYDSPKETPGTRHRRWRRECAIKSTGPWLQLKKIKFLDVYSIDGPCDTAPWREMDNLKLLDVSFALVDADSSIVAWALTTNGKILVATGLSQTNPMEATKWEYVHFTDNLSSISCGPYNQVWLIGNDGCAYRRKNIHPGQLCGEGWSAIDPPIGHQLRQVSVGEAGVWAVDEAGTLYFYCKENDCWRYIITEPPMQDPRKPKIVFKKVMVAQNEVCALTDKGVVMKRIGICSEYPLGYSWSTGQTSNWQHFNIRASWLTDDEI